MSKLYSEGSIAFVRSSLQRFEKQFWGVATWTVKIRLLAHLGKMKVKSEC